VVTAERAITRSALTVIAAVLLSRVWFIFHRALDPDELEHAHAAWCVARGQIPYVDFFEHHTPWLYLLFAPPFRYFATDTDAAAAVAWLVFARLIMLAMTTVIVVLVYTLGVMWRDRLAGVIAAALIATASQFLDTMLEFRPDVPALLCFLMSLVLAMRAWRADRRQVAAVTFMLSGFALGGALMFTQKYVFVLPGFGAALLVYMVKGTSPDRRSRAAGLVLFALGVAVSVGVTAWWFAAHHALGALIRLNVGVNLRLSAQPFSPLPRLLSNVVHMPALWLLGIAGFVEAAATIRTRNDDRLMLVATAASLFVGLFTIGKAYEQYFVMFFPHLAVFGAAFAQHVRRIPLPHERPGIITRVALLLVPLASMVALLAFTSYRYTGHGIATIAGFALAAVLACAAVWQWLTARGIAAARIAFATLAALSLGNLARTFEPMSPQIVDLTYVTERTRPTDTVFGASAGAGVFRPHAWYYFFNSGLFASDRELADLADAIETSRIQPQIVVLEPLELPIPAAIGRYVRQHYRHVHGTMYERLSD
jgi:4-amino-4-deoxy-L-arabinose transferase-like glycosyltransferase